MIVPVIRLGGGDFFCLWVTMFTTEPTHYIGELAHRVSGKISRSFTFKVNAEFPCDGYGKVVDFVSESILELRA